MQVTFGGAVIIEEDEDSLVKESLNRNKIPVEYLENCSDPENEEGAASRMDQNIGSYIPGGGVP